MLSCWVVEVFCSAQRADEEVLSDELYEVSILSARSQENRDDGTYMSDQDDGGK